MSNYVHLVCVTGANNNKYYDMKDCGDGTFEATYGRIGVTATKITYPISKWDSTYSSKIRKGYQDMTSMVTTTKVQIKVEDQYKPIEDDDVAKLIDFLRSKAKETIRQNYTVASEKVTTAMVNSAQTILNALSNNPDMSLETFNRRLIELFTVIPRRMSHVADYLASDQGKYAAVIQREQNLLDVMAGQVSQPVLEIHEAGNPDKTVLEAFGLQFSPVTENDVKIIKRELGECAPFFYKAWRVENLETRKQFKAFTKGKGRITKKLYWHGSRTENWWSILRTGLKLRPTNAVINGKMFGYGLYFAPKARKSLGYTSLRGSCWVKGSSHYGFMALYEVVYGKPYEVSTNFGCSDMNWEKLQRVAPGCSSLHAHAGQALRNDEVIVYREDQTTIKYLVELKS